MRVLISLDQDQACLKVVQRLSAEDTSRYGLKRIVIFGLFYALKILKSWQ